MSNLSQYINFNIGDTIKDEVYTLVCSNDWLAYNLYHKIVKEYPAWEVIVGKNSIHDIREFNKCFLTLDLKKSIYKSWHKHFFMIHKDCLKHPTIYQLQNVCSWKSFVWLCSQVIR